MTAKQRRAAKARWEHFQHVADIGVRGLGLTVESAFVQAALAMTAVLTEPATVRALAKVEVACEAPDLELLFADWLNALLYEMATRRMLFARFAVKIVGTSLNGEAWGEAVDTDRHAPAVEIKGATYTALKVAQTQEGLWLAQCVVDV
ncbi:archease [Thiovibrio sp. JS02]